MMPSLEGVLAGRHLVGIQGCLAWQVLALPLPLALPFKAVPRWSIWAGISAGALICWVVWPP